MTFEYDQRLEDLLHSQDLFDFVHPQFGTMQVMLVGLDAGLGIAELVGDANIEGTVMLRRFAVSLDVLLDRLPS